MPPCARTLAPDPRAVNTSHFFIFGAERSGTGLLARLISAHPAAFVLEEAGLFHALADAWRTHEQEGLGRRFGALRGRGGNPMRAGAGFHELQPPVLDGLPEAETPLTVGLVREFARQLRARYRRSAEEGAQGGLYRAHLGRLDPRPWIDAAKRDELTVQGLLEAAHRALLPPEWMGASVLGEKSWAHLFLAPWIGALQPAAVRIVLVRHPVANVAAIRAASGGDLDTAIARYKCFHMARFQRLYDAAHGLVLRYEDLVNAPGNALAAVRARLGVLDFPLPAPDPPFAAAESAPLHPAEEARVLDECGDVAKHFYPEISAPRSAPEDGRRRRRGG